MRIRVAHLYPDYLNIYADRGNIAVLARRAALRGHAARRHGDRARRPARPVGVDLLYVGGGQDREQALIAPDLAGGATAIAAAVDDGCGALAVCGGYQLLGRGYRGRDGVVDAGRRRACRSRPSRASGGMIGDVLLDADLGGGDATVAGFENHAGRTLLDAGASPLGRVVAGLRERRRRPGSRAAASGRDRHVPPRSAAAPEPVARRLAARARARACGRHRRAGAALRRAGAARARRLRAARARPRRRAQASLAFGEAGARSARAGGRRPASGGTPRRRRGVAQLREHPCIAAAGAVVIRRRKRARPRLGGLEPRPRQRSTPGAARLRSRRRRRRRARRRARAAARTRSRCGPCRRSSARRPLRRRRRRRSRPWRRPRRSGGPRASPCRQPPDRRRRRRRARTIASRARATPGRGRRRARRRSRRAVRQRFLLGRLAVEAEIDERRDAMARASPSRRA